MRRAEGFRLRPTARQHVALAAGGDAHREVYNAALQERRDAWSQRRTRIFYGDQSAQLTEIRQARSDQAVWSFSSQQATLRRLNKAFDGFFRRVKCGEKAGYLRFKGKARFDSSARWRACVHPTYLAKRECGRVLVVAAGNRTHHLGSVHKPRPERSSSASATIVRG